MALQEKQKNKLRLWIRVSMVFIALVLLLFSVVIPFVNNAIALDVENDLKSLPLPEKTTLIESTSKAGKIIGNGNGMQYFGAILIKSDLYPDELAAYYADYDCYVSSQPTAAIHTTDGALSFRHEEYDETYFIVYRWGSAPDWARDWLNTDVRGH